MLACAGNWSFAKIVMVLRAIFFSFNAGIISQSCEQSSSQSLLTQEY